ncbi:translation initiation factor eIF-2A [Punctularia strigosozonata HHB-11173 SS5]|uniref:translation initiation factor eIF-2A n=1 Tax=Punctularia strigosozonata (strain HHB-11173) TaxID=741275 RepID=UPI000441708A|nr:translation initiation factor eIF-2A [Punctularia strigosozonata HHB-11173 SS5]EIN07884.1 translation initiation factor eIF-2A [Punctularia strigosozonata HHB-11173 SS5]
MAVPSQQYAFRAQKSLGLVGGTPDYAPLEAFKAPESAARTYQYSSDGRLFALALPEGVFIYQAESAQLLQQLQIPGVVEINFSPRGTYISTWERPVKLDDGSQHKNLRIFSVSTGEELASFTQKSQEGWDVQYTISESHAIRLAGQEIQVFNPADWSKGVVDKLKVEGVKSITLSPGLNPSVAVFIGEKKGAPAIIRVLGLLSLNSAPTGQKTFYKADRATIKWNTLGTQVLILTQTDVDAANKSYYGETGLYLLSAAGNFDCRVTLDKEGPIHDFAWSPNSKEFGVVYGFMPAKAMIFDQRVRTLHDFGAAPQNFISFNPQGRLVALAGFGNLAGKINVYDRRTLAKVTTIDAPNTSHCEWSPDGRFLLTATLSPRLRVDNGIKIWHCTGPLVHVQLTDELYQVGWRPTPVDALPPFGQALPPAPAPAPSDGEKKGQRKRKGGKDKEKGGAGGGSAAPSGAATPVVPPTPPNEDAKPTPGKLELKVNGNGTLQVPGEAGNSVPPTPGGEAGLDPVAKKVRNLNKKLKAIDELKDKQKKGERLEATQLKKIETEAEIRKELSTLTNSAA